MNSRRTFWAAPVLALVTTVSCGPVTTLASGDGFWTGIAVDATSVYWTTMDNNGITGKGTVMKVEKGGGNPTTLAKGQTEPSSIAVDATSVYWVDGSAVMKVGRGGGNPTTFAPAQAASLIAVDATSVYWVDSGAVMKVGKGGGNPIQLNLSSPGARAIAVDATSVYWTWQQDGPTVNGGPPEFTGGVTKVGIDGGTPATLAKGPWFPLDIAVDATSVYWTWTANRPNTNGGDRTGGVTKVGIDGGTPTTLASGQPDPRESIAVDATNVYWTNHGMVQNNELIDSAVMTVGKSGGNPTTLASASEDEVPGFGLAVDATSIYWIEDGLMNGAVKKLAK